MSLKKIVIPVGDVLPAHFLIGEEEAQNHIEKFLKILAGTKTGCAEIRMTQNVRVLGLSDLLQRAAMALRAEVSLLDAQKEKVLLRVTPTAAMAIIQKMAEGMQAGGMDPNEICNFFSSIGNENPDTMGIVVGKGESIAYDIKATELLSNPRERG